jgi:hypothetical protein
MELFSIFAFLYLMFLGLADAVLLLIRVCALITACALWVIMLPLRLFGD